MAGKNRPDQPLTPHVLSLIGKKCKKTTRNHAGYRHASGWVQRLVDKSPDNAMKCL
jgi:hypothetical protein